MAYQTVVKHLPVDRCTFAFSGTYGHECGAPAVKVAVETGVAKNDGLNSEWVDGIFYAGRCEQCAAIKGGENAGRTIEALNGHVNKLACVRWVADE